MNEYYTKISELEFTLNNPSIIRTNLGKYEKITDSEFSIISRIIKGSIVSAPSNMMGFGVIVNNDKNDRIAVIIKLKDDWYNIYNHPLKEYYACDQIEGLVKFIKDKC